MTAAARVRHAAATVAAIFVTVMACGLACAPAPDAAARVSLPAPDTASFPAVAAFLDHRCGSLDCHGQVGRNFLLYGSEGLRLDPSDVPGGRATTPDEIAADYASTIGLEPEVMSAVVQDGGAAPERLTLIRKARGTEHHKGGALVMIGDPQDRCLTSWLAGALDAAACAAALTVP